MDKLKNIAINYLTKWNNKNEEALDLLHPDFKHKSPDTDFKSKKEFVEACWGKFHGESTNVAYAYEDETSAVIIHKITLEEIEYNICEQFHFEDGLIRKCKVWY